MASDGPNDKKRIDVAIIGSACRFPGGASNETTYWDFLHQPAYSKVPKSRYNVDAFHQKNATHLNNLAAEGAHFLEEDISAFDAPFFNINEEKAKAMDPSARILLESSYAALENAGIPQQSVRGSNTGCYVGCFTDDWKHLLTMDPEHAPMHSGTGTGFSLLSNRISHYYDMRGPSMTIDTACSSSLVALHLACQSLSSGESDMALVCGVNVILAPNVALWYSSLRMLSPDGVSRSFAQDARGYGRGEGVATVVLKPLASALRDGDTIRAVIKGTGVNQDGHTRGITVPNPDAQAELIRQTYQSAGLDFARTGYFEAHGTGTAVGDPIELAAVAKSLRKAGRTDELIVGSVKANIGHLEGAAGLAGLIKCMLMLEKGIILPNIHFEDPSKSIPFDEYHIRVPTDAMPWPTGLARQASINSFGYGGTNAHAILQAFSPPSELALPSEHDTIALGRDTSTDKRQLFVLSGQNDDVLRDMRSRLLTYIQNKKTAEDPRLDFDDLSYTLGHRRSHLGSAAYHIASTFSELENELLTPRVANIRPATGIRLGFIFTGQSAQWPRMGMELLRYKVFRQSIEEAEQFLTRELKCGWRVIEELLKPESETRVRTSAIGQPLCTIVQVAMVDLLRSWQIYPAAVTGHSSGEIAAAYCAGALTDRAAWEIAFYKGLVCETLRQRSPEIQGSMIAVGAGADIVRSYLDSYPPGQMDIACFNSPSSVTVSGDSLTIQELLRRLNSDNIFARELPVDSAYHSHHMSLVSEEYLRSIAHLIPQRCDDPREIRMSSSVTGKTINSSELTAEYWVANLVSPVLFSEAVSEMMKSPATISRHRHKSEPGIDFLVEVGPHAALRGPIQQILESRSLQHIGYASVLHRNQEAVSSAMRVAGELYCRGLPVDIKAVNNRQHEPRVLVDLPAYPWDRSLKYWTTSRRIHNFLHRSHPRHSLLGVRTQDSDALHPAWTHFIDMDKGSWIKDHIVHGSILYPAAGFVVAAIEAALQLSEANRGVANVRLEDFEIQKALVLSEEGPGPEIITHLWRAEDFSDPRSSGWWKFSISCSRGGKEPQKHASGRVSLEYTLKDSFLASGFEHVHQARKSEFMNFVPTVASTMNQAEFYKSSRNAGLVYGPDFRGIVEMSRSVGSCTWRIEMPDREQTAPGHQDSEHLIHPTTLDVIVHTLFGATNAGEDFHSVPLPVAFDSLIVSADMFAETSAQLSGYTVAKETAQRQVTADIHVASVNWDRSLVRIQGLRCTELPSQKSSPTILDTPPAPLGSVMWKPDIDVLDVMALKSYVQGAHNRTASADNNPTRVLDIAELIVELKAFKDPTLSILQVGGADWGLNGGLLPFLRSDTSGVLQAAKTLILDPVEEKVTEIQQNRDFESLGVTTRVLDTKSSLSTQISSNSRFDVVVLSRWPSLTPGASATMLTDARAMMKPNGWLVAFDPSCTIDDRSHGRSSAWEGMVIERSTGGETATHDTQHTAVAAADHPRHIYLLLPPHRTRRAALVAEELSKTLPDDGFLVSTVAWPPNIAELKGRFIISLLELDRPLLSCLESADFDTLRQTVLQARRLLWVCAGSDPRMEIAIGLLRVLQNENISKQYQHILLEDKPGRSASDFSRPIAKVIGTETQELEFSERDGWLHIPRWMHEPEMTRTVAKSEEMIQFGTALVGEVRPSLPVRMLHGANLDNAHFVPDISHDSKLLPDEVEIEICSIVLNEDDTGSQGSLSLREASGVVKAVGRDVSGLRPAARVCVVFLGHLSSNAVVKEAHCHQIPDSVSMREAACLPITFATAYRAVIDVACVRPRQTVFVQAAGTKIGRAAALLAKASGAIVYATTEDHGEVKWLEALGVSSRNIFVKGDPDLVTAMRAITKGRGLDVIIRTSEPKELHCSLSKCLAPNGSLVDIRYQAVFPGGPHAETSAEDITNFVTSAGEPLRWDSALRKKTISNALGFLSELSTIGKSSISFSSDRIVKALKCQRKQSGRRNVLLSFDDRDRIPISPSVENRFHLTSQATYVLAGGMGGVGRGLARFLVANGARSLVFLSRSGAESSHAKDLVKEMENKDVEVAVFACDVADGDALAAILATCRKTMPPIRGVIQAATVIRDAIFDNLTSENWQTNLRPKVQGSWNLHTQLPRDMDFFVMLSSIVGLIGHRSQAGYAAGNTYQDALAHYRRARGLPAVSIDLGAMADVGTITEGTTAASFSASDAAWMNETELHRIASMCISGAVYRRPVPPPQVCTGLFTGGMLRAGRQEEPIHFERPFFAVLKSLGVSSVATEITTASTDKAKDLIEQLGLATSIEDAHFCISEVLRLRLTKELGLTPEAVDLHKPLHQYDIDSLKAVDLKSWIGKVLKADVSTFDVLNADSVSALASEIVRVSELVANGLK